MWKSSQRPLLWGLILAAMTLGIAPFPGVELAGGANRDLAIYREATATDPITSANFDHDWDTTVTEDTASINLNGDNRSIELQSGHYLVLYGSRFESTGGSNRSEIQTQLRLGGADLPIGWSQGYIRRIGGADEAFTSGGGIINVANDYDALTLRSFRTDSNHSAGVQRAANASGIQVLKIDDNWDYARLKRTNPQVGPNSTAFLAVQYDSQDELDTGSFAHSTSVNPENIMLKPAGHYMVFANTYGTIGSTSRDRTLVNQKLTLDGIDIDGTLTTVYIRGNANNYSAMEGAASIGTIIETTAANQILNVQVNRGDGTAAFTINQDDSGAEVQRTAITIVKLPDSGDYVRLDDSGTDNMNPGSLTPMGWDTEDEIDAASFSHPEVNSRIEVNYGGEYLFLSTLYAETAGVTRAVYSQGWTRNGGGLIQYGQSGSYNRRAGANHTGNWSGFIAHDLVAGDYVEVAVQAMGRPGTVAADVKGIQGVRLSSLMPRSFSEKPWETAALGDVASLNNGFSRTSAASLGDSFELNRGLTRPVTSSFTLSDAHVLKRGLSRPATSSFTLGDAHALKQDRSRTEASPASLTDRPGMDLGLPRTTAAVMSDSFTLARNRDVSNTPSRSRSESDPFGDFDGDRIMDRIDGRFADGRFIDESTVFTSEFSDQHLGGSTFGRIANRGDLMVELSNARDPAIGLQAIVSGRGKLATLVLCTDQFHLNLTAGDTVLATCGSLTVTVLTGQVELDLGQTLVVNLGSGATSRITDLGNGRFVAENPGASGVVTAVENGRALPIGPGERAEIGHHFAVALPPTAAAPPVHRTDPPSLVDADEPAPVVSPEFSDNVEAAASEIPQSAPIVAPASTPSVPPQQLARSSAATDPAVGPPSDPSLPEDTLTTGVVGAIALGTLAGAAFIAIVITLIGQFRDRGTHVSRSEDQVTGT